MIRSNDDIGDSFVSQWNELIKKEKLHKELFEKFIGINGYAAWHERNGWVNSDKQTITWIGSGTHSNKCPDVGQSIVIIKGIPYYDTCGGRFGMDCYNVVKKEDNKIFLEFFRTDYVIFNRKENKYQFYSDYMYENRLNRPENSLKQNILNAFSVLFVLVSFYLVYLFIHNRQTINENTQPTHLHQKTKPTRNS